MSNLVGINDSSQPTSAIESQPPPGLQILEYSSVLEQDRHSLGAWGKVLQRVIKAIVTIKVNTLRTFDTHGAGRFEGTGFVVDRTRGLILSNRHVVTQGPVIATATFGNYEEINLQQSYFDPVHDFGFFRYDPNSVKFAEVEEIELYPEGARVGLDIKVCGNDAGEKLSILSATLARLDRSAPSYGFGYNDFNVNYFQAASGTTHGSSGSPVLDVQGRAIALNAGASSGSATGFYLPLEPIVRALRYIQKGEPVPRGTVQTIFLHTPYDELKRLGFPEEIEKICRERNRQGTGLLTARRVLPEGPGYMGGLEPGDALISCSNQEFGERSADDFHRLWEVIDGSVDKDITLTVYRGGERKSLVVHVQDLHSITPNSFLEIGDGIYHTFSYQLAMSYYMPCRGVFAAVPGMFSWMGASSIITQVAGKPITSLQDLEETLLTLPDRSRVGFRYHLLGGRDQLYGIVDIDHHFYPCAKFCRDATSSWHRQVLSPVVITPQTSKLNRAVTLNVLDENRMEILRNVLFMVKCLIPYTVDGITAPTATAGVGMLVATSPKPLIVTSRAAVPTSVCDIYITIGKRNISAQILHLGLVAILTVDKTLLPSLLPIPTISTKEYIVGDPVEVYGLNFSHQLVQRRTEISGIAPLNCPESAIPAWRFINTEGYALLDTPKILSGVIIDPADSSVIALWIEINLGGINKGWLGLDYRYYVQPIIEALKIGEEVNTWSCGCVFEQLHLSRALDLGLPEHNATIINNIARNIGTGPQVVWVHEVFPQSPSGMEVGDFILEIDDEPVGRIADIRHLTSSEFTNAVILRNRETKDVVIRSEQMPSQGPRIVVCWAGAIIQQTPSFALERTGPEFALVSKKEGVENPQSLVYISTCLPGSPANGILGPTQWILQIEGWKVASLEDLLRIIEKLKGRDEKEYIRVKCIGQKGIVSTAGMKLNSAFWPAWVLKRRDGEWIRSELE